MPDTDPDRNPLELLAEEFVARYRRGERPAVSEYAARRPDLADEIRDLFPALVVMEDVGPAAGDPTAAHAGPIRGGRGPDRVGDFRILREVGRGGMGVVYEAEQESLGRRVALKVLPPHAIPDARRLVRFHREARAAARLHHTNIVPVFGVGEADGVHYYAMQFIRGQGLDQVLAELRRLRQRPSAPTRVDHGGVARSVLTGRFDPAPDPTPADPATTPPPDPAPAAVQLPGGGDPSAATGAGREYWRSIARIGLQAADALAYAHAQGVVHRDVKPSNLLLDTHGTVWVADFGLAKAADSDDLTHTGDLVGTLRYMAPERLEGHSDARADVFALGATLYELATLRPAFDEADRGRLLRQVAEAAPPRPRRVDPAVPRDLETVILKAMARDPARRYQTAADLADDLRQFVADRSIKARRATPAELLWRWCRRNPAVAGLATAVGLLLTVVAVGGVAMSLRLADALGKAESDRDAARTAEREGKERLYQSLVSEAKARRFSRRVGQRFDTLDAVRKTVALARELDKPPEAFAELRTLAAAALALPDLRPDAAWVSLPTDTDDAWQLADVHPDGRLVAVRHQQGAVSIRRLGSGPGETGEVARLPGLGGEVNARWSPDGRHLAVLHWSVPRIRVWRLGGGAPVLAADLPGCQGCCWRPDGRRFVTVRSGRLHEYDPDTGADLGSAPAPAGAARVPGEHTLAYHPHRPELAVATPAGVILVNPTDGREVGRLPTGAGTGTLAWHPHGELLAVHVPDHTEVWDVPGRRRVHRIEHPGGGHYGLFNPAGDLLVTGGWSGRLRLWNPYTAREAVFAAVGQATGFGPGDRLGTALPGRWAEREGPLTAVEAGREYRTLIAGVGRWVKEYCTCAVHPGGRLLAVATLEGFSLQDLGTGAERAFVPGIGCDHLLFEPDGSLLTKVKDALGLYRWPVAVDPADPARIRVGPPESVPVPARGGGIARSRDGRVMAAADYDGALVWGRDRPREYRRVGPHPDCRYVAVSPDGTLVATGAWHGRGVKVWDAATGRLVRDLLPEASATIPQFSPDRRWLLNRGGESFRVADWSAGPRYSGPSWFAFSPDGRLAASAAEKGVVRLFDPETGRDVARLEDPHQDGLHWSTFSPDGTLLIGTSRDSFCVRVWDLRKIRRGLAELGLDWDAPPYPPAPATDPPKAPLDVRVYGADYLTDPAARARIDRDRVLLDLRTNPFDPEANLRWAGHLLVQEPGAEGRAVAHLTLAVAGLTDPTPAHRLRVVAHRRLGRWADALADADAALRANPDDAHTRLIRAEALIQLARPADAVPDLDRLAAARPDDWETFELRAACHRALGRADAAAADRDKATAALDRAAPTDLNNRAWFLANGPPGTRDPGRALDLIHRAVAARPGEATYLNTLGVVLYRNGRYPEAVAALERSLAAGKGQSDGFDLFVLAACRHRLGDPAGAQTDFERAVGWTARAAGLTAVEWAELAGFRAEAEAILRSSPGRSPAPPPRPARPGG